MPLNVKQVLEAITQPDQPPPSSMPVLSTNTLDFMLGDEYVRKSFTQSAEKLVAAYPLSVANILPLEAHAAICSDFDLPPDLSLSDALSFPFTSTYAMYLYLLHRGWSETNIHDFMYKWQTWGVVTVEWWMLLTPFTVDEPKTNPTDVVDPYRFAIDGSRLGYDNKLAASYSDEDITKVLDLVSGTT